MCPEHLPRPSRESGTSAVEFAIAAPALLLALLGTFQAALLYQARAQLEVAAQEAVRAGTLHGASLGAIQDGLARGLTPLFTHGQDLGALGTAYAAARVAAAQAEIRILNPTREAFADFAEQTRDQNGQWVKAIPVDHLGYRQTSLGNGSGVNVQDATLLKIQVTYYHPLIIPFVDRLFAAAGGTRGQISNILGHPVLPLSAEATQSMQSPVLPDALPTKASLQQQAASEPSNSNLTPITPPERPLPNLPPETESGGKTLPPPKGSSPAHVCG